MNIEQLELEFKRYEILENKHGFEGDNDAAYFYMNQKWAVAEQIEKLKRGAK